MQTISCIPIAKSHVVERTLILTALLLFLVGFGLQVNAATGTGTKRFEIGAENFLLDGEPLQIRCGEIHYARVPREYWKHRIEMVRASGMNAVCVYLFWNFHERKEGEFTWEGRADVAEFCRMAQEAGLWVVLRPGPYSCAEWEMGGLPWWLLKHDDIALRSCDKRFTDPVERYFAAVGEELGDLQVTKGGPILMVQVENEYGFYGDDVKYMQTIKNALKNAGFEVPLFACNPPYYIGNGYDPELFQVVNFGSDPEGAFEALRAFQKEGPLMCGEFYPAWFDTWGNPHHDGDPDDYIPTLDRMMEMGASYSIYMVHGGTTFGFWAGADRPFKPDTSSYDYDAPVSEAGWPTDGFYKLRAMVERHLSEGERLPEAPAKNPVISFDPVQFESIAGIFDNLSEGQTFEQPQTFEDLDNFRGGMVYQTQLPAGAACKLKAEMINDFGWVYLDGQLMGITDRRSRSFEVQIPARTKNQKLEIFVWTMGRINFGPEIHDRKGIHGPIVLEDAEGTEVELKSWTHFGLPMEASYREQLQYTSYDKHLSSENSATMGKPAFWKTELYLEKTGDTFLDMSKWGKGVVWVNGHDLGRFWNIGPTQTMYVPGPWLKQGKNEIVVFDILGPQEPVIAGLETPELSQLRPELDFAGPRRRLSFPDLAAEDLAFQGTFNAKGKVETIEFETTQTGKYVAVKTLSSYGDKRVATLGELDLMDANGDLIPHTDWTVVYVSSEERYEMDGTAENAIDGQTASIWSTYYAHNTPDHPHILIIDLGSVTSISGIRCVPGSNDGKQGFIEDVEVYIGNHLVQYP